MPVVLHSHGNIREIIPHILEAGFRAIDPLENGVGMDVAKLKKEYGKDIVLIGGIDGLTFRDLKKAKAEIMKKVRFLKGNSGYVYSADSPVMMDVNFDSYEKILEGVKEYGAYQ
jgi:uroporphyrinogen decarboxylase